MPLEVPVEDLKRDLLGCVVMHKNKPVYVTSIGRDGVVVFRDLLSQREDRAPFTLADFSNPVRRLGFVNIMGSILYVSRIPVRRYHMGVCANNITIKSVAGVDYPQGGGATKARASMVCIPELADAIMNKYPTLSEACKQVKQFGGAVAFDKQFAISAYGQIFYKGQVVGKCGFDAKDSSAILWVEGKKHLSILLDGNHEKTVRDFSPTKA